MKYEFKMIDEGVEIVYKCDDVFLPDLLENIQNFLKAAGFQLDGRTLELNDDEVENPND